MHIRHLLIILVCIAPIHLSARYFDPGFPAAITTLVVSLTGLAATIKMEQCPKEASAERRCYAKIRNITLSCMGPLLLLTAYTCSDKEARVKKYIPYIGMPLTIASLLFWLIESIKVATKQAL